MRKWEPSKGFQTPKILVVEETGAVTSGFPFRERSTTLEKESGEPCKGIGSSKNGWLVPFREKKKEFELRRRGLPAGGGVRIVEGREVRN